MADNGIEIAGFREDYYRDGFGKLMLIMASMVIAIILLLATSMYLYLSEPPPISFSAYKDMRVQQDQPLDMPYLDTPSLLQWVNDALMKAFQLDFINYNDQLQALNHEFTDDGWRVFVDQINTYANANDVQTKKQFISAEPDNAPQILNSGVLLGRYAWWVSVPVTLHYVGNDASYTKTLNLQVLVVRVPTLNNLMGVGIDNMIVVQGNGK